AWYLSIGLLPKAGVTIVLVHEVNAMYPQFGPALATVMVSAIVILELIGPPLAAYALRKSGEAFEEGQT
ncbi:MAG: sodium:proton exchanger, partial [Bacteroidota bacterium]